MAIYCDRATLTTIYFLMVGIILAIIASYLFQYEGKTDEYRIPISKQIHQIIKQMDQNANPCEDFPKFVCGNSWNNNFIFGTLADEVRTQIHDMSNKSFLEDQHVVLKTAIKLFEKCMIDPYTSNDTDDYLHTILMEVGGWPLLQDSNWTKTDFDWLEVTYKLREMGFPHSQFFDLSVTANPRSEEKFIFKISMPKVAVVEPQIVKEVAGLFGAHKDKISFQIEEIQKFVSDLNNHSQIEEVGNIIDYKHKTVDWREFFMTIAGPTIKMRRQNIAIFPQAEELSHRLDLLARTSKRTQANYLVWKIIEEMIMIRYPKLLQLLRLQYSSGEPFRHISVEENCLNIISRRFPANPIEIMYARKYIPPARSNMAHELLMNLKTELLNIMKQNKWMDKTDKRNIIKRLNTMKLFIGAPEEYYDDGILDEMNNGLEETNDDSFLSLLLKINKNYQNFQYQQINWSSRKSDKTFNREILKDPQYSNTDNTINVPLQYLHELMFSEDMPNYLNYGGFGMTMGSTLYGLFGQFNIDFTNGSLQFTDEQDFLRNITKEGLEAQRHCLVAQVKENFKNYSIDILVDALLQQSLGVKLSYLAYQKLSMGKNPEPMLRGLDYTPNQLFWISSARILCGKYDQGDEEWEVKARCQFVASLVMNNENFARDFNCTMNSKMNPTHKCNIF